MIFDIFQRLKAKHRHQDVRQGRAVSLVSVLMDRLRQKEAEQHLSGLTPQRAVELFANYRAGKYADVQLVWDELEEQDDTLKSIVDSRLGGLAEMPWRVSVRADLVGDNQELQTLAEQQQRYVESLLRGVDNLEEAIEHLGMADFRGYAALEMTGEPGHMRWEVIEPWNLARPLRNGPWLYNPEAQDSTNKLEELEMRRVILRETRRPIDLAAMFLIVEKSHGTHAWDAFLDTFGVPSIFFELAPNTSEEDAQEFDAVINRVLAEGRGTLPNGTKVQTVETSQNSSDAYKTRAEWCRDALLTLGLGGTLTATAESGSGTLAGNAHADSLARLCARSARGISTAINRCFCWPEARKRFPGSPLLVEFDLSHEEEEDKQAMATMFATLAGARYRAEDAVVSEHLGVEVTTEPMQPAMPGMMSRAGEEPARMESREEGGKEGEPLSSAELEALRALGGGDLKGLAAGYEDALTEAVISGLEGKDEHKAPKNALEDKNGQVPAKE